MVENSTVKNIIRNHLRYITYNNTNQIDIQKIVRYNKYRKLYLLKIGGNFMLAVNYTNLRENMKSYMDKVTDDYETMIVTRKDNKNVVMISEETYNNMLENMHVMGNKSNYDWLMESKEQLEKGKCAMHNLLEDSVMNKVFTDNGWKDYVYWQTEDRKTLKKINSLIEDICRNGNEGIGKPEPLRGNLAGFWSRRINDKDRLIYSIDEENVYILSCRYHYSDT